MMERRIQLVLGVPVDDLTLDEAVARVVEMVDAFRRDGRPRQVATVNVDFLVNALAWRPNYTRHPELLDILRRADTVTADGMPIVWASRLQGAPLKERVAGSDLVPRLAEEAARRGLSLYFLGGREGIGARAAEILTERHPGLRVAGIQSPYVHVEGEELVFSDEEDAAVVQEINRSGADILLVALGNPKQEIWFHRNRDRLKVPVSIGVGGTFEFIAGTVSRAPAWMQRTGLEWIYRIGQDPRRLWKRYVVGLFKFSFMIALSTLYYRYRWMAFKRRNPPPFPAPAEGAPPRPVAGHFLAWIELGDRLDAAAVEKVRERVRQAFERSSVVVLDFGRLGFIDSSGLALLMTLWRQARVEARAIYGVGIRKPARRLFEMTRTWDVFRDRMHDTPAEVLRAVETTGSLPAFYFFREERGGVSVLHLFGSLDAARARELSAEDILASGAERGCILDLTGLEFLDSSGLGFFLKLQRELQKGGRPCIFCNPTHKVDQLFRITRVDRLFRMARGVAEAAGMLEAPEGPPPRAGVPARPGGG